MSRAGRDPELAAATSAHYEDPAYYTSNYADRRDDVDYYVAVAKAYGGPVLEYGCGNGRITLRLAREGLRITGVDLSRAMLGDLRAKLRGEANDVRERVSLKRGDMRSVRLPTRYPLVICPFNAFLHLYDRRSVERFLARVAGHLAPRGRFVFDVSAPQAEELARDPKRAFASPRFQYPGIGPVRYKERFDYEPLRQILFVSMEFEPTGSAAPFMTPLAHRQFFPAELEALLHYNGFRVEKLEGDFDGPADNESMTLIYTTRVVGSARARR